MEIKSLKIKTKNNYDWDGIVYINDFDSNLLEIIKRESRIGANIYYIGYVLNPNDDYNTVNPLYFVINRLIGYIEEIEGSSDKYLVVAKSMHNRKIIHSFDTIWSHIEHKRFNSDIDLPLDTLIEFRSLVINVNCVIEKDGKYYPEIYLDECLYVTNNI